MPQQPPAAPWGSVIVPAHDEESVLPRQLAVLAPLARAGKVEVIVVPNGCTDATAAIAREAEGVRVIELAEGSKIAAINAGDAAASHFPRIVLDADVQITAEALEGIAAVLGGPREPGAPLAGRPASVYDTSRSHPLVRANYRARLRAVEVDTVHLWGAGIYAISEAGRARYTEFPPVAGDDYWIDQLFAPQEKVITPGPPVVVTPPLTPGDLLAISTRTHRGNTAVDSDAQLSSGAGHSVTTGSTLRRLISSVRGPRSAADALVYTGFALAGRWRARRTAARAGQTWERDNSSRSGTSEGNHQ